MSENCSYFLRSRARSSTQSELTNLPSTENCQQGSSLSIGEPLRSSTQSPVSINHSIPQHYLHQIIQYENTIDESNSINNQSTQSENATQVNTLENAQPTSSISQSILSQSMSPLSRSTYYTSDEDDYIDTDTDIGVAAMRSYIDRQVDLLKKSDESRAVWEKVIEKAVEDGQNDTDLEPICPICLQDLRNKSLQLYTLKCGHIYTSFAWINI